MLYQYSYKEQSISVLEYKGNQVNVNFKNISDTRGAMSGMKLIRPVKESKRIMC